MLQRTITSFTVTVTTGHDGYEVQTTTKAVESTLGSGTVTQKVERYSRLAEGETRDLLELLAHSDLPGTTTEPQPALF